MFFRLFEEVFRPKYVFNRRKRLIKKYGLKGKSYHDLPYFFGSILCTFYAMLYAKLILFWIVILVLEVFTLYVLFFYQDEENDNIIYSLIIKQKYNAKSNRLFGLFVRLSIICIWIYSWSELIPIYFLEIFIY